MNDIFKTKLQEMSERANEAVLSWLPPKSDGPGSLADAMRYSVLAGGKRIRPVLLLYACEAYGGKARTAGPFMAAMEYIHTSSLIHDDLPAIDNDSLRRGQPTVHCAYGEAIGILSGDALLNHAYEVLLQGVILAENKEQALEAARIISQKSGSAGMLGGQSLDVEAEKGRVSLQTLESLNNTYERKTSALIEASLMSGAALAGAAADQILLLEKIGSDIGLAFQIRDDILDETSTEEELGKPIHSDARNLKETYCSLLGIDGAQKRVDELAENALKNTELLSCDSLFLREMIRYLQNRKT